MKNKGVRPSDGQTNWATHVQRNRVAVLLKSSHDLKRLPFPPLRWKVELADLRQQRVRLLGDCLLCSSFLAYLGAFSWEYRDDLLRGVWEIDMREREIPLSNPFHVENLLTNEVEVSKYENKLNGVWLCLCISITCIRFWLFPFSATLVSFHSYGTARI